MGASTQLTRVEARLFVREPMLLFFGLLFPPVVLLALGYLFPGFDEPSADLGGARFIDIFSPTIIALALATLGLTMFPTTLSSYRQLGILRRFRTTPVHPARLLLAQLTVNAAVAIISSAATVVIARLAFDVAVPELWGWFGLSVFLALASMFAIGLLIGAIARTATASQVIGFALFFPLLFMAGLWIPRPIMSGTLLTLSDLTPLGAAVQAMTDSWAGTIPSAQHLIVMAVCTLICGLLAVRLFRWE